MGLVGIKLINGSRTRNLILVLKKARAEDGIFFEEEVNVLEEGLRDAGGLEVLQQMRVEVLLQGKFFRLEER